MGFRKRGEHSNIQKFSINNFFFFCVQLRVYYSNKMGLELSYRLSKIKINISLTRGTSQPDIMQ